MSRRSGLRLRAAPSDRTCWTRMSSGTRSLRRCCWARPSPGCRARSLCGAEGASRSGVSRSRTGSSTAWRCWSSRPGSRAAVSSTTSARPGRPRPRHSPPGSWARSSMPAAAASSRTSTHSRWPTSCCSRLPARPPRRCRDPRAIAGAALPAHLPARRPDRVAGRRRGDRGADGRDVPERRRGGHTRPSR